MNVWAVIIAIEDYPNLVGGWAQTLPGTNQAAEMFRDWVMQAKNVPAANILACAGAGCAWRTKGTTRKDMVDAFNALVVGARDKGADEVYVLFSGHGIGFSDDANAPVVDILIGSEFGEPSTSGAACLKFSEVREKLRLALGPGKHFYFIDACRNAMTRDDIDPNTSLGAVWGRSSRGNATSFVLFSTAPGDGAKVDSGFNTAILGGLKGNGRAKAWIGGNMHVTFDSLSSYVQQMLQKYDLEPEKKGPLAADGRIVYLTPTPMSNCEVEVIGAGPGDQFTLSAADVRNSSRAPVTFVGPHKTISFSPEDYLFQLTTTAGTNVLQVEPPPQPAGVDLYEHRKVRFQLGLPATPVTLGPTIAAEASVTVQGIPNTNVIFHELTTGRTESIQLESGQLTKALQPGRYKARMQTGNFKLKSSRIEVLPGETQNVDFSPKASRGAKLSLSKTLPIHGSLIDFSETLSNVPDWNLSLWLAVIGGSRIVGAPDMFSKLQSLQLENFAEARPGKSMLYVLAGELDVAGAPTLGVGNDPTWKRMEAAPDVPGLFQFKFEFEPGPLLVSYAMLPDGDRIVAPQQTTTIMTHGFPNRATLVTFVYDEQYGRQIQQFVLPIHSLMDRLSERELKYLHDWNNPPLPMIRYMSTAQRLFALQAPIKGNTHEINDRYWSDLLDSKWLNPLMALIACYELIRRGSAARDKPLMREVLYNMRNYFPGVPDTEVIAMLIGEKYEAPSTAPLLMDGTMAVSEQDILPLPEAKLDFDSIWTSWRNAVAIPTTEPPVRERVPMLTR
jgi:hypothetical protein